MSDSGQKVFGLGFSKTGTTSLERALDTLGYSVCRGSWRTNHTFYLLALYVNGDLEEILRLVQYWDAFADGPWGGTDLYRELFPRYPEAKYILTHRDPEAWYNSLERMISKFDSGNAEGLAAYHRHRFGSAYFFRHVFNIDEIRTNRQKVIDVYRRHNESVVGFFERNDASFLRIDITAGAEWDELCPFLGKEIPSESFPHANPSSRESKKASAKLADKLKRRVARVMRKFS